MLRERDKGYTRLEKPEFVVRLHVMSWLVERSGLSEMVYETSLILQGWLFSSPLSPALNQGIPTFKG
jgi:hypothetical protein